MNRFLIFLVILFVIGLVLQQSNVFEKKQVLDSALGVYRDEYHCNWGNLQDYLNGLPDKFKHLFPQKR